jgi:phospho-N-acetylmuramoyl-pentapeptide-transferase
MEQNMTTIIYASLLAFAISAALCPLIIPLMKKLNLRQSIRSDGPQSHLKKAGTPFMGGIAFVAAFTAVAAFFIPDGREVLPVILCTLGFCFVGFCDDYIKRVMKRSLGLRFHEKLIAQIIVSGLFTWYLYASGADLKIFIPFTDGYFLDLGYLTIPFVIFAFLGF